MTQFLNRSRMPVMVVAAVTVITVMAVIANADTSDLFKLKQGKVLPA